MAEEGTGDVSPPPSIDKDPSPPPASEPSPEQQEEPDQGLSPAPVSPASVSPAPVSPAPVSPPPASQPLPQEHPAPAAPAVSRQPEGPQEKKARFFVEQAEKKVRSSQSFFGGLFGYARIRDSFMHVLLLMVPLCGTKKYLPSNGPV